ncbi:hypothetical protein HanHA300_Chr13g0470841 [Helianthus annuus]|nr:hypothetical protein HanHA300_Chr13g0470841 [Helianthus annuus]KAJ0496686.1 hypothetical protein HanHA89_Chr13g0502651 [Helianthus annuus]KAJ0662736.1 hypothetical protein HanLR1_Chr13g0473061 [Helianthus annuus]
MFEGFDKFKGFDNYSSLEVEGIEVQPLENVEHIDEKQVKQPILDSESDANWEEKMPTDYEDIMESSGNSLQWTTKEEAYSIIRKGFFINIRDEDRSIPSKTMEPMNDPYLLLGHNDGDVDDPDMPKQRRCSRKAKVPKR